jgi:hypothetical protein
LITSLISRENRAVALKVIAARAGTVQLQTLLKLKDIAPEHPGQRHLPELLDHFKHKGPNGTQSCLVFEVSGENIGTVCGRMFPCNQLPSTCLLFLTKWSFDSFSPSSISFTTSVTSFMLVWLRISCFANAPVDISSQNVLVNITGPQSPLVQKVLESHPGFSSYGPWAGSEPRVWRAGMSSDDRIDAPGSSIRLMDSEAIRSFESISENDYSELTIN